MTNANIPVTVPPLGESVHQATVVRWLAEPGAHVREDEALLEIETEKVTLEIYTPAAGYLAQQRVQVNDTVKVGDILGEISKSQPAHTAGEVQAAAADTAKTAIRKKTRQPLSHIRQRIAKRLKQAQNTAAILTTFNEVDMTALSDLRRDHGDAFAAAYGIKPGYLSFFVRICTKALQEFPLLNSYIEDQDVITPEYQDISVAISSDDGLVVPVITDCARLNPADIEMKITDFAQRAQNNTLQPDEMQGGTFTVSNGGVYGSLWSTPILNPPQSAILGLHKIEKRPVVIDDAIVIRPMMYLALSYDHRLIDGREAVRFLVRIKELAENPQDLFS